MNLLFLQKIIKEKKTKRRKAKITILNFVHSKEVSATLILGVVCLHLFTYVMIDMDNYHPSSYLFANEV